MFGWNKKGKPIKNQTDGFDIDWDDLDMPDMEMQSDPFGDEDKPSRGPIKDFVSGFGKGILDTDIEKTVKDILPREYGTVFDLKDSLEQNASEVLATAAQEYKRNEQNIKRTIKTALEKGGEYELPPKLQAALKKAQKSKWLESDKDFGFKPDEQEDIEAARINKTLHEVFGQQMLQQESYRKRREKREEYQSVLEHGRFQATQGQLNDIRMSVGRMVNYQDTINIQYQRKSLELQLKSHQVSLLQLDTLKTLSVNLKNELQGIRKNTGLSDYMKSSLTEASRQMWRNRFLESSNEVLLKGTGIDRLVTGAKSAAIERIKGLSGTLGMSADMADMFFQNLDGKGNLYTTLGKIAGNKAREFATDKIRDHINKKYPQVRGLGNLAEIEIMNIESTIRAWANRNKSNLHQFKNEKGDWDYDAIVEDMSGLSKTEFRNSNARQKVELLKKALKTSGKGILDKLIKPLLGDIIRSGTNVDTALQGSRIDDMRKPGMINQHFTRSVTEIIPGYLARILREVTALRTGDDNTELLMYDFNKRGFTAKSKLMGSMKDEFVSKANLDNKYSRIKEVMAILDKEGVLRDDEKETIGNIFARDVLNRDKPINAAYLQNEENFKDLSGLTRRKYKKVVETFLNDYDNEDHSQLVRLVKGIHGFKDGVINPAYLAQEYTDVGYGDLLEGLGVTKRDDKGNLSTNSNTLFDWYVGKGRDITPDTYAASMKRENDVTNANVDIGSVIPIRQQQKQATPYYRQRMGYNTYTPNVEETQEDKAVDTNLGTLFNEYFNTEFISRIGLSDKLDKLASEKAEVSKLIAEDIGNRITNLEVVLSTISSLTGESGTEGSDNQPTKRRGLLRRSLGKLKDGSAWFGRWYKNYLKNSFSLMAAPFSFAGRLITGKGKQTDDEIDDIYLNGDVIMTEKKLREGYYRDLKTNKAIFSIDDITGTVVDINGDVVLEESDINKAYVRNRKRKSMSLLSKLVKLPVKAFGLVQGGLNSYYGNLWKMTTGAFRVAKGALSIAAAQDVYLKGEDTPVLSARLMRKGAYFDRKTGKPIYSPSDIDGTVVDKEGNVVLSAEDLHGGLYNKEGQPIGGTFKRIVNFAMRTGTKVFNAYRNVARKVVKLQFKGIRNTGSFLKGLITGDGLNRDATLYASAQLQEETNNTLMSIYQLLDDRLPGRKIFGDTDNDGDTEGSVKDLLQKRLLSKKAKGDKDSKEGGKDKEEKEKEKGWLSSVFDSIKEKISGGLMAAFGAIATSVFGGIKKLGKSAWGKLTGKSGKIAGAKIADAAGDAAKGAKGGWFGKMLSKLGKGKGKLGALAAGLGALYMFFGGSEKAEAADNLGLLNGSANSGNLIPQQQQAALYGMNTAQNMPGAIPDENWEPTPNIMTNDRSDARMADYTSDKWTRVGDWFSDKGVSATGSLMGAGLGAGVIFGPGMVRKGMNKLTGNPTIPDVPVKPELVGPPEKLTHKATRIVKDGFKQGVTDLATNPKGSFAKATKALKTGANWKSGWNLIDIARGGVMAYQAHEEGDYKAMGGAVGNAAGGIVGGIVGQALIPIPVVGGLIGSFVGSFIGDKVGGKLYELGRVFTRRNQTDLDKIRLMQYGVNPDNIDICKKIFDIEDMLMKFVSLSPSGPTLKPGFNEDRLLELVDGDADSPESMYKLNQWFNMRFKPFYLLSLQVQQGITGKADIEAMDKMNTEEAIKFLSQVKMNANMYPAVPTPFTDLPMTEVNQSQVTQAIDNQIAIYQKDGKKKDTSESKGFMSELYDKAKVFSPAMLAADFVVKKTKDLLGIKGDIGFTNLKNKFSKVNSMFADAVDGDGTLSKALSFTPIGLLAKAGVKLGRLFGLFKNNKADALTVIRMKAYGLNEMNESKVKKMLSLEERMLDKNIVNMTNGNLNIDLLKANFREVADDLDVNMADYSKLEAWLQNRFLPVFTAFVVEARRQTGSTDFYTVLPTLAKDKRLKIADAIRDAKSNDGRSIWQFVYCPLEEVANIDSKSTHANYESLKNGTEGNNLKEEAKAGMKNTVSAQEEESKSILQKFKDANVAMWDKIKDMHNTIANRVKDTATALWEGTKSNASSLWDNTKAVFTGEKTLGEAFSDFGNTYVDNLKDVGQAIKGKDEAALMLYNAFRKAGFSHNQARVLVAEVGRENGLRNQYLFGTHKDDANGKINIGMISWQGARAIALMKYLASKGLLNNGRMVQSQAALDAQAEFLRQEMMTKSFGASAANKRAIDEFLGNPNIEVNRGMDLVGQHFIKWAITNPKYREGGIRNRNNYLATVDKALAKNGISNNESKVGSNPTLSTKLNMNIASANPGVQGSQNGRDTGSGSNMGNAPTMLGSMSPSGSTALDRLRGSMGGVTYNRTDVQSSLGALPSGKMAGPYAPDIPQAIAANAVKLPNGHRLLKAIATLRRNATQRSRGKCAYFVRMALNAAGIQGGGNAKEYATNGRLESQGFRRIPNSAPSMAGDIKVFTAVPGHPYGHICMYDGTQWISDFVQRSPYAAQAYRNGYHVTFRDGTLMGFKPVGKEQEVSKDNGKDTSIGTTLNKAQEQEKANAGAIRANMKANEAASLSQGSIANSVSTAQSGALPSVKREHIRNSIQAGGSSPYGVTLENSLTGKDSGIYSNLNERAKEALAKQANMSTVITKEARNIAMSNDRRVDNGIRVNAEEATLNTSRRSSDNLMNATQVNKDDFAKMHAAEAQRQSKIAESTNSILKESLSVQKEQLKVLKEMKAAIGDVNGNIGKQSELLKATQSNSNTEPANKVQLSAKDIQGARKATHTAPLGMTRTPIVAH